MRLWFPRRSERVFRAGENPRGDGGHTPSPCTLVFCLPICYYFEFMAETKKFWRIRIVKGDKKRMISLKSSSAPGRSRSPPSASTALVLGGIVGTYVAVKKTVPDISSLETYEPSILTSIYADDGQIIKEIGPEKRIVIAYEQIPEVLRKAILATEDPRFFKHKGIDIRGVLRAVQENVLNIFTRKKPEGGQHHHPAAGPEALPSSPADAPAQTGRMVISLQIEKRYSKEKIFEMYCNQFELGHGAFGIEAASHISFRQERRRSDPGRSGRHRRNPPRAVALFPLPLSGPGSGAAQPCPEPHGRGEVHPGGAGRGG